MAWRGSFGRQVVLEPVQKNRARYTTQQSMILQPDGDNADFHRRAILI